MPRVSIDVSYRLGALDEIGLAGTREDKPISPPLRAFFSGRDRAQAP